ncbi:hypothetical protein DN752_11540 [Echinicola strongylocentroti]|uniref:DUF4870 domain-containing protein n=1 Tax=Echinicola strongylocentroti TaxID=1795355 RepID=A0A2Z4IJK5_9BACT|nr:DUF4870 domain-containing protein [Echinicola strongylocentroti]AWW30708.1 hypothetical protein DN752_11540 [Echinicola strongylocentroti]
MIHIGNFSYKPSDHEAEKASNSYLMSLIAVIAGLPLPIINLLATLIFYLGNRKGTYFVRWHCTQALVSQFSLFIINTIGFWWTLSLIFKDTELSNMYIAYMIMVMLANLTEFIVTIYSAIQIRKGIHIEWWLYGSLTHKICKES